MNGPTTKTAEDWRQNFLIGMLVLAGLGLIAMASSFDYQYVQIGALIFTLFVSVVSAVFCLVFMKRNFGLAYGCVEIVLGLVAVSAAFQTIIHELGSMPEVPKLELAILGLVTAFYFVVRGVENAVKGEGVAVSPMRDTLEVVLKNHPDSIL
jgi:FtsH-binding integral membrane protein